MINDKNINENETASAGSTYMKNPNECVCIQIKQTFFVLNELEVPEYTNGSEPLTFHHSTFSRFVFVIINENKKAVTANVGVRAVPGIIRRIENLYQREMVAGRLSLTQSTLSQNSSCQGLIFRDSSYVSSADTMAQKSPAYTTALATGFLAGKTPAELLLENGKRNRSVLVNQKKWLEENLSKYPKNKAQIEAIEDALHLYDEGKLKSPANTDGETVNRVDTVIRNTIRTEKEVVYKAEMRPLLRKRRSDGKCPVYEISILWNGGSERPVEILIQNYYAPVIQKENGLLNVQAKEKVEEVRNKISLTIDDWLWVAHALETNIRTFEDIHALEYYKKAAEEKKKMKEAVRHFRQNRFDMENQSAIIDI